MTRDARGDRRLVERVGWELFRQAIARLTRRERDGLRLYLLRRMADEGDRVAALEAESLAAQYRRQVSELDHAQAGCRA